MLISHKHNRGKDTAIRIALFHGILVFALWMLLFVSKWFPYGPLAEVRDWFYRFF